MERRTPTSCRGAHPQTLHALCARFGEAEWLERGCSAGDLMMVAVLLRSRPSAFPSWRAYVARFEAQPEC